MPAIDSRLHPSSSHSNFRFSSKGSRIVEKNPIIPKQATPTETFDSLMLPKKKSQCRARSNPAPEIFNRSRQVHSPATRRNRRSRISRSAVNSIRHQTITPLERAISFPKMPVNPANRMDR